LCEILVRRKIDRPMTPPPDLSQVKKIWLRAPNWVGDLVMATAAIDRLRTAFPRAEIVGGMRPILRPMLSGTHWFDRIVDTPRASGLAGLWRQVQQLRAERFDLAVVLPNSIETGLIPYLAGVPLRLGYRQGRPFLLNLGRSAQVRRRWFQARMGPRRWATPMPNYYRDLLDCLGIEGTAIHPILKVLPKEHEDVQQQLRKLGIGDHERIVLFVVGANFGSSKLWMPERFAAVAKHFQARGLRSVITVGPAEKELGQRIAKEAGVVGLFDPVLPLDQLKALVARSVLLVTGDTGPRHLAVALDRPVVCLMGPNDPNYTDYCMERQILIRKELPCSPCQRKVCPLGHHQCMRDITVAEVIAAGEQLLATWS
jgi:heptosyltransferase-2